MRVTSYAQQNFMMTQIQALQTRIADQNIAVTSGKKAQRFDKIAVDAKELVTIEATHVRITRYVENNNAVDQRLQQMETAASQLVDIAGEFRTRLLQAINLDNASQMGLDIEARSLMDQVAAVLNTEFDGRHLFAGSMTNTAPVDLTDPNFLVPPSVYPSTADTNYYQGDAEILQLRAGPDNLLDYGITADNPAFEKLIRALHLTATAIVSPVPDDTRLNEALRVIQEAIAELPIVVSDIGATRKAIETANKTHDETLLYAEQTIGELSEVDLVEAITRMEADRASLEASFAALAQMRTITLLNFL